MQRGAKLHYQILSMILEVALPLCKRSPGGQGFQRTFAQIDTFDHFPMSYELQQPAEAEPIQTDKRRHARWGAFLYTILNLVKDKSFPSFHLSNGSHPFAGQVRLNCVELQQSCFTVWCCNVACMFWSRLLASLISICNFILLDVQIHRVLIVTFPVQTLSWPNFTMWLVDSGGKKFTV